MIMEKTLVKLNGDYHYYEDCVNLMDDDLREEIACEYATLVTEQEFLNIYCEKHLERFGEKFEI